MRIIVIGGTGTIGSAVVAELSGRHEVLVASRSSSELPIDIADAVSIRRLFDATGPVDAVVCAAGEAAFKPLGDMTDDDYAFGLNFKLMGQLNVVRLGVPFVRDGGSISLTSGATCRRPMVGSAGYSMVNAAIEGYARAAALELPRGIRLNAISPTWVDTTLIRFGMDPAWGVDASVVAQGYVRSVEGTRTGVVFDAGWRYDTADADYVSLLADEPRALGTIAVGGQSR